MFQKRTYSFQICIGVHFRYCRFFTQVKCTILVPIQQYHNNNNNNNNNVLVVNSGSWIPNVQSKSQYLQVDLLQVRTISAIMTQGRNEWECNCGEWVTLYTLSYSLCGSIWSDYIANGSIKVRLLYSVTYHYVRAILIILIISISFAIIIIESYPLSLYFCPSPWPLSSSSSS